MSFISFITDYEKTIENTDIGTDLQRTDGWFELRKGRFTGSKIKDLMSCDRSVAKMEWGRPEKIISLGEAAKKYIFVKAMERKTGKIIKTATTKAMQYGTEAEPFIVEKVRLKYPEFIFKEVGFKQINKYLGASPDGELVHKITKGIAGIEIKASTNWETYYSRVEEDFCRNHIDFWQIQTEMLALKTKKLLYCVAEPPENIMDRPIEISNVHCQFVEYSPIHIQAILQRAKLGNQIIETFLETGNFKESLYKTIENFEI